MTDLRAEELFDVLDERGRVVGRATRRACHSNPALMHQAVHVLVFDGQGRLWPVAEIEAELGQERFTPNFEFEFRTWKEHDAS